MRLETRQKNSTHNAHCSECGSTSILYQGGKLTCRNCGHEIYTPKRRNKFNASPTIARDGRRRDSKFEASVADELLMLKAAGEILDYDSQYKVMLPIYNRQGEIVKSISWKIDFRLHLPDGSFKLLEAKGKETYDYQLKRDLLQAIWLPEHPDHVFEVRKMSY